MTIHQSAKIENRVREYVYNSSFYLDLLFIASQTHFHLFIWTYSLSPVELIFIFSSGLTLYCQSNSFSSFHLDLLSIASQTHLHLFIWTYSLLPVNLIFIFFLSLDLPLIASFIHLDLSPGANFIHLDLFPGANFIHLPGLTFDCQFFSIFLTWTYL